MPRRDRGFVPDCLFAGNRGWIKASRFASRFSTSFCRISIAIGHDSASSRLPRLIRVSEREPGWPATFVPFVTRIRLFPRCISRARTNLSLPRILSLFFLLFFCPSITTPRFNPPKRKEERRKRDREVSRKRKTNVLFRDDPTIPSPLRFNDDPERVTSSVPRPGSLSATENEWKNTAWEGGEKKKHPALLVPA